MIRKPAIVFALTASAVVFSAIQPARAQYPNTGSKPGIGVSGVGVSAVFVPAPGVATPTVQSRSTAAPMVSPNVVASKNVATQHVLRDPGVVTSGVQTQMVTGAPGVAVAAPPIHGLPSGYYTTIPPTAVQKLYKGETCYYADGVYYRPEYYLGSVVYVRVA